MDYVKFEKVDFTTCHGKNITLEIGNVDICFSEKELEEYVLRLVMIRKGTECMYLLTNISEKDIVSKVIYETYLCRWKIEEYFKFKKQQYNLEKTMIRSLNGLRMLQLVVSIITGYLSIIAEEKYKTVKYCAVVKEAQAIKKDKKVKLHIYRLAEGMSKIFSKLNKKLRDYFVAQLKKQFPEQQGLFDPKYTYIFSLN